MPTFERPDTFVVQPRSTPRSAAAPVDMAGILADRIVEFIAAPAAYTGLSAVMSDALFEDVAVYQDPDELRQDAKHTWIFVTPAPVPDTVEVPQTLADIGVLVNNPSMPAKANRSFLHTEVGKVPQTQVSVMQRSVIIGISMETRAATFRAGDALYTWLTDMLALLKLEFDALSVKVSPLQTVGDEERPLFASFPGDPAIIQVVASSLRRSVYSLPDPP